MNASTYTIRAELFIQDLPKVLQEDRDDWDFDREVEVVITTDVKMNAPPAAERLVQALYPNRGVEIKFVSEPT